MIDLILATDMAKHGEIIENFKQVLVKGFDHEDENHRTKVYIYNYRQLLWDAIIKVTYFHGFHGRTHTRMVCTFQSYFNEFNL